MLDQKTALDLYDKGDYNTLINEYEVVIYHYLHKFNLWNRFSSYRDDFLQEGRLAILKALTHYNRKNKLSTYLHASIRNALFNYIKKMKLYTTINDLEYNDYEDNNSETASMETLTLYENIIHKIENHKNADVLKLYFIDELSQSEIGAVKNISQQRVAKIINTFREEVKPLWK